MSDDAQAGSSAAGTLAHSHSYASSDALTAFSRTPPIPSETGWANEIAHEAGYETDMERCERETHHFSSEPLVVAEGVAVTEEGVAEHIPDVVTERHV